MLGSTYTATDTTINYTYDDLAKHPAACGVGNRLTAADYSNGMYYHYEYDSVGNRMQQVSAFLADPVTTAYAYNTANRLVGVATAATAVTYRYNGDGNRLQQSSNGVDTNYTLELNSGLSQVLADGTNTYLYGMKRLGMSNTTGNYLYEYDALGSVRQMENIAGLTLAESYDPYGNVILSSGQAGIYGYTGEEQDSANGLVNLRARTYLPVLGIFPNKDTYDPDPHYPSDLGKYTYVRNNPIRYIDPTGYVCLDPWAPTGVHFDPNRGCEYPEGSTGSLWWRKDSIGPDTENIDMPWVDEQSQENWNKNPNSCGASALYMFLKGEGITVNFDKLSQQLRDERPGGYDGYCCRNSVGNANGTDMLPTATIDPTGWCNSACVSGEALASVARNYYGMDIVSGDNWTQQQVYQKVSKGHPVLTLIRSEVTTDYFGHFVVVRGFSSGGWTVEFNDSYPGEAYWDVRGGSSEIRRKVGERRESNWEKFDRSWSSHVDDMDPLAPGGHVRWAMAVR